ncbi:MAG TPA: type I polyketide synthase, partial [Pseudonocardiaceae bacterium]|nr:type I polyketide synthase [Pseudonocardiaceae bacterium]
MAIGQDQPSGPDIDRWRYRDDWEPITRTGPLAGSWLIVFPAEHAAQDWIGPLTDAVDHVLAVEQWDRAALAARLRDIGGLTGVLFVTPASPQTVGLSAGVLSTMALLQALGDTGVDAPLWCVTRGAVTVDELDAPADPAQAGIWGLGRVAALEHPERWGGLIDLPAAPDVDAANRVRTLLGKPDGEDQIAIRPTATWGRRLVRAPIGTVSAQDIDPQGTVLITGGTGALGAHVARWLAGVGVDRLLLVSRRGPAAPGAAELVAELAELGAHVSVVACDVADRDALAVALADLDRPLTGIIHAAGVLHDGLLDGMTTEDIELVIRSKVDGLLCLDEVTRDRELSFFVAFSSIAGSLGSAGQGNYAAANAMVDAVIRARRADGLPGLSVAWGGWAGTGMAADRQVSERFRRGGIVPMPPGPALDALQVAIANGDTVITIADIDWQRLIPAFTAARPSPLLSALPEYRELAAASRSGLATKLAAMAEADRLPLVMAAVRSAVARALGYTAEASVPADRAFRDLGFDSLTAVELRNDLATVTGLPLPSTAVFDHPSPRALAEFVVGELVGGSSGLVSVVSVGGVGVDPVVIVGMDCRFPGGVGSPDELWDLVVSGAEGLGGFPTDRGWDVDGLMDPAYAHVGGFVDGVAGFDAGFFG